MGKAQKKTGKGRLDKYYKLAKEQGYRARSAFKLIQLNKKYSILDGARCTIDLCAAPGGWLQVASKYMPPNSIIVGIDLVPIKPIPRVVTFAADITTPVCRNMIRGELKDWKADVVLHDGAPNVGTAWIQDAYSQSELVLMSLKLAVEFLAKGGTFVTKVFRSVDYNNLIWVFNQLFGKVEATKPPSSRNVSAEIFVVCRDFLAPKHIDPKFLDPKHVFKELTASASTEKGISANAESNVFHPEKKRRHRDGYADGDYTLFKTLSASTFVKGGDPVTTLGSANQITFTDDEEKEWLALDITTADVKANCDDLKVLGKGDFKTLIKWRLALREAIGLDVKSKQTEDATEATEVVEIIDEEEQISEELERLNSEAAARTKRERRKANEKKTRTIQRMQLQMTAPLDIGLEQEDATLRFGQDEFFDLGTTEERLKTKNSVKFLEEDDVDMDMDDASDNDEAEAESDDDEVMDLEEERSRKLANLEDEIDGLYDQYQSRLREKDAKFKVQEARRNNAAREEWRGIIAGGKGSDDEGSESEEGGGWDKAMAAKLRDDDSSASESSEDEDDTIGVKRSRTKTQPSVKDTKRRKLISGLDKPTKDSAASRVWFSQDVFSGIGDVDASDEGEDESMDVEGDEDESETEEDEAISIDKDDESNGEFSDDIEVVPIEQDDDDLWVDTDLPARSRKGKRLLDTPEAVTLAQQLVNREKTKTELINEGFNRYSLNSKDGLPSWFLDDESKHYKANIPVTKEAMVALRAKQRALDARPIKKVAEAKARKKFKAAQRIEKAMKKAEGVNATADMTEKEKAQQIEKVMRKGMSSGKAPRKDIKVVVAKGAHKGLKGRPKGVKGRYLMVDSRMKKELRAKKRKEKANKKR